MPPALLHALFIAAGGAVGSVLRFGVQSGVQRLAGHAFPFGTLAVNVAGCLAIGFLASATPGPILVRDEHRLGLMVGLLGGFTTFSSFGMETFNLQADGQFRLAAANVIVSVAVGLAAVWAGHRVAGWWFAS